MIYLDPMIELAWEKYGSELPGGKWRWRDKEAKPKPLYRTQKTEPYSKRSKAKPKAAPKAKPKPKAAPKAKPKAAPKPSPAPTSTEQISQGIVDFVKGIKGKNPIESITFSRVYDHIQEKYGKLTIGQYHDVLRDMYSKRQIMLNAFTQALFTLPDRKTPMYLNGEVMYYVEMPREHASAPPQPKSVLVE